MSKTLNRFIPKEFTVFEKNSIKKKKPVAESEPAEWSRKRGEKSASGTGRAVRGNILRPVTT